MTIKIKNLKIIVNQNRNSQLHFLSIKNKNPIPINVCVARYTGKTQNIKIQKPKQNQMNEKNDCSYMCDVWKACSVVLYADNRKILFVDEQR